MRPVLKIPYEISLDKTGADRLIDTLYRYADEVDQLCEVHPEFGQIARAGVVAASYDLMLRVAPANSDTLVTVQLPPPKAEDGGRILRIARVNSFGTIMIVPIGTALLNGASQVMMYGTPGIAEIRFDGVDFWSPYQGGAFWGNAIV